MDIIFLLIFLVIIIVFIGSFIGRSLLIIVIPSIFGLVAGSIKSQQIQAAEALSGYHTTSSGFTFAGSSFSGFLIGILTFIMYAVFKSNMNENVKYIIAIPAFMVIAFLICVLRILIGE